MRILYVDDDALAIKSVARELRAGADIHVTTVTSPLDALELVREATGDEEFDVILSDFSMPEMDGVEFLEETLELQPQAKRLLLTGSPDEPRVQAALRAGLVVQVLAKPVSSAALREAVGVIVRSNRTTPRDGTPII